MSRLFLFLNVLLISGCANYSLLSPTARSIRTSDLVGEWYYQPHSSSNPSVSLRLDADSIFKQTVQVAGESIVQSGTWSINGTDILLTEFNGWEASNLLWCVIDQNESPSGFAILGGDNDPDLWVVLEWVR